MVVHGNFAVEVFRQQGEQAFRVHWCGVRFAEMQILHPLIEKRCEYFVFLHKECGFGHDYEFHPNSLFSVCKLTHFFRLISLFVPKVLCRALSFDAIATSARLSYRHISVGKCCYTNIKTQESRLSLVFS